MGESEFQIRMRELRGVQPRRAQFWDAEQRVLYEAETLEDYPAPGERLTSCPTCNATEPVDVSATPPVNRPKCGVCRRVVCGSCPIGGGKPRCPLCGVMLPSIAELEKLVPF